MATQVALSFNEYLCIDSAVYCPPGSDKRLTLLKDCEVPCGTGSNVSDTTLAYFNGKELPKGFPKILFPGSDEDLLMTSLGKVAATGTCSTIVKTGKSIRGVHL